MDASTEQIVEVMRELVEAQREARATLVANEELLLQGIAALEAGGDVVATLHASPANAQRRSTQAVLDRIMHARHQFRLHLIGVCRDAGMTPREIAEEWGISRQRVDQFVQEYKRSPTG